MESLAKPFRTFLKKVVALLPKKIQKKLFGYFWAMRSPDRVFLVQKILPLFAKTSGTMLWVGCERYTRTYPKLLEKNGGTCWTLELEADQARWGNHGRHVTGDLTKADHLFPANEFDVVFCNGVFGWGINTPEKQREAFEAMAQIMKPGATLLLGWNTYRSEDPVALDLSSEWFEAGAVQGLQQKFQLGEHVYEILRKKA